MNTRKKHFIFLPIVILAFSLACSSFSELSATATPETTATSFPTNTPTTAPTATKKPTFTPRPTFTPVPPTATAAPVGVTVSNADYDVDVLKVRKLGSVYLDQNYVWQANPGYLFLELGVKVTNKQGGTTSIPWENIYVIEEGKQSWYPGWGGFQTAAPGETLNPASIIFEEIKSGKSLVSFKEVVYLRLIWTIKDNNPSIVYFGFDTSPLIEVRVD